MAARCPVCGSDIRPEWIPAVRGAGFECSRCRTSLKIAPRDQLPILLWSIVFAVLIGLGVHSRGIILVLIVVAGLTVLGFAVITFLLNLLCVPKLQRSAYKPANVFLGKRIRPVH